MLGIGLSFFYNYKLDVEIEKYRKRYKHEVVQTAINALNRSITFDFENGISLHEFNASQLFYRQVDRYHAEDLFVVKDDKTSFYLSEVHAEYKTETYTKSGRQGRWQDILKGIVFCADFNKNFSGVTVVSPRSFGSSIGAWFSSTFSFGKTAKVTLENNYSTIIL